MNLNILKPGNAVRDSLENPNLAISAGLVAAFLIVYVISRNVLLGIELDLGLIAFLVFREFAKLVFLGVVVYLVAYLFAGKNTDGKFNGILSAISLRWIVVAINALVLSIVIFAIFSPASLNAVATAKSTNSVSDYGIAFDMLKEDIGSFEIVIAGIGVLAGLVLLVWREYLLYSLVAELVQGSILKNLFSWLLVTVIHITVFIL